MKTLHDEINEILDTLLGEWGATPAFEKDQVEKSTQAILATTRKHLPEKMRNYPDYAIDRADGYNQAISEVQDMLEKK